MTGAVLSGVHFMQGNIACAEGAIAAGCRFYAGYPITPSSEIAERMARRLPPIGGHYIQMEDELGSMAAVLGASNAGVKSMTATSGPGMSLMVENIGLGVMMETPCVVVNVQRAGPSTGMPTLTSQGDMLQARWGSHGDYEIIAYVPNSVQEMFDLTTRAFNVAERYRTPVIVLADQVVGHMTGKVTIPPEAQLEVVDRRLPAVPPGEPYRPFGGDGLVPAIPNAGTGYRIHVTGLTHDERGYPDITPEAQQRLLDRLVAKIRDNAEAIGEIEERETGDAQALVVAYGSTSRSAWQAVKGARRRGIRAGLLRLVTAWPFPAERVRALSLQVEMILVPEGNYGQMIHPVREASVCPVYGLGHPGGGLLLPEAILEALEHALAQPRSGAGRSSSRRQAKRR